MQIGKNAFLKKAGALCLAFAMAVGGGEMFEQAEAHPPAYRGSSIVIDAQTGKVYSQSMAAEERYPASLTKIMTMMVAFDAIKAGKINLETELITPRQAREVAPSVLGLKEGQHIKVKTAISALIIKSANDVAVTLAHSIAGSERAFVRQMNKKAQEIGLKHTHFANAHGLFDKTQVTTARDMAKLGRYLINQYPGYYEYFSGLKFEFEGITYGTHNRLLEQYEGMDGIKTGYIKASGFNIVSSAKQGGIRLIGVVFGGETAAKRDDEMASLLNDAFAAAGQGGGLAVRKDKPLWQHFVALTPRRGPMLGALLLPSLPGGG